MTLPPDVVLSSSSNYSTKTFGLPNLVRFFSISSVVKTHGDILSFRKKNKIMETMVAIKHKV